MKLTPKIFSRDKKAAVPPAQDDNTVRFDPQEENRLVQNLKVFQEYNERKKAFLYHLLPGRKKVVFDLVPVLIHAQAAELLSCVDDCRLSPYGVFGFEFGPETKAAFREAFPGKDLAGLRLPTPSNSSPPIKSISLIGSLGSVAQGAKSDFDYWVCYEPSVFGEQRFENFINKLKEIERWAENFAGAEVHFFPMTAEAVRANDFGMVDSESAGTAQGKLLKEEFYRTMTLAAGQTPLWWIMPPGIGDDDYVRLRDIAAGSGLIGRNGLIDLGNVYEVSDQEFYGAAIWQINKVIGSPFKSVLKLALLEEYLFGRSRKGLLCHELKTRLQSGGEEAATLDPYILMLDRASDYFLATERLSELDLLRRSMFIKAGVNIELADYRRGDLSRKKQIMLANVKKWQWNHRVVDQLNNYQRWSFRDVHRFNREINRYLATAYANISKALQESGAMGHSISQRDLAVLGRKLYIFYSRRTNKIDSLKSVTDEQPALKGLTLQPETGGKGERTWHIYRGLLSRNSVAEGLGDRLKSARFLDELLLWLVFNRLYSADTTININQELNHPPHNFTLPDLQGLIKELNLFFPASGHGESDEKALLKPPAIRKMFVVVNIDTPDRSTKITSSSLSYLNTWGEVFFKGFDSDEGIYLARDFIRKNFAYDPVGIKGNFAVFLPARDFKRDLSQKLNKFFGIKVLPL